jgi:2-polyprenyl-3-methyl-5-hydroxy-6-metoxy-1,4-benzoquinol methylase
LDDRAHWEEVYRTKSPDSVSWYQPTPQASLDAIARFGGAPGQSLIDIGGGASSLAAELARAGWRDLAVLDISAPALEVAKAAMGAGAATVDWIAANITTWRPARTYEVWHDRAVFHFMTSDTARAGYLAALRAGLKPGGLLLMATFALDGPEKCSGLPVQRYGPDELAAVLGEDFTLLKGWRQVHATPGGNSQAFNWCAFRKAGEA